MKQNLAYSQKRESLVAEIINPHMALVPAQTRDILSNLQQATDAIIFSSRKLRQKREALKLVQVCATTEQKQIAACSEGKKHSWPADITEALSSSPNEKVTRPSGSAGSIAQAATLAGETQVAVGEIAACLSVMLGRTDTADRVADTSKAASQSPAILSDVAPADFLSERIVVAPLEGTSIHTASLAPRQVKTDDIRLQITRLTEEITRLRQARSERKEPEATKLAQSENIPGKSNQAQGPEYTPSIIVRKPDVAVGAGADKPSGHSEGCIASTISKPLQPEKQLEHTKPNVNSARLKQVFGRKAGAACKRPQSSFLKLSLRQNSQFSMLLRLAAILLLVGVGEGVRRLHSSLSYPLLFASLVSQKMPEIAGMAEAPNRPALATDPAEGISRVSNLSDPQVYSAPRFASRKPLSKEAEEARQAFNVALAERSSFDAALAAGDPRALFENAVRLTETGSEEALMKATLFYYDASEKGFVPALFRLGLAFEKGLGLKVDKAQAASLYERAARGGNIKAMHNLAALHVSGFAGSKPDYARAAELFRAAAERGLVDSQFNYALLAARGLGTPQNTADAFKYLSLAVKGGDSNAALHRDRLAQTLTESEKEAIEQEVNAFRAKTEPAEANEKTLPSPPWLKRDWSLASHSSNL